MTNDWDTQGFVARALQHVADHRAARRYFLELTRFSDTPPGFKVEVTDEGLSVYSDEGYADVMDDEIMLKVRDAINAYFESKGQVVREDNEA